MQEEVAGRLSGSGVTALKAAPISLLLPLLSPASCHCQSHGTLEGYVGLGASAAEVFSGTLLLLGEV